MKALLPNPVDEADECDSSKNDSKDSTTSDANSYETLDAFPLHIRSLGLNAYPISSSGIADKEVAKENIKQSC